MTVPARVCHFAGCWAGVVDVLTDVYVGAVGAAVPPDELALANIGNGDDYGFDLREPLGMDALKGSRAALPADMVFPPRERPEWRSDHLALMP